MNRISMESTIEEDFDRTRRTRLTPKQNNHFSTCNFQLHSTRKTFCSLKHATAATAQCTGQPKTVVFLHLPGLWHQFPTTMKDTIDFATHCHLAAGTNAHDHRMSDALDCHSVEPFLDEKECCRCALTELCDKA